jgi:hypothetical protein
VTHPGDEVIKSLALGTLTAAESVQIQHHMHHCSDCLKRLIAEELALSSMGAYEPAHRIKPDVSKPLFVRHATTDGFIYSLVERKGRRWVERHWGEQLDGSVEYATMREANEYALVAFAQMFPEHRCTERCRVFANSD